MIINVMVAFISPFGPSFLASFLLLLFPFFVGYMFCYCMFFAGCSKCLKEFTRDQFNKQNYGGYSLNTWVNRNGEEHKRLAEKSRLLSTNEEKQKFELEYGVPFSELFLLPYFDPV